MEHRWSQRARVSFPAVLHCGNNPPVICTARNVGREGAFVAIDPRAWRIRPGLCAHVDLRLPYANRQSAYSTMAVVVHCARDGVGLMFAGLVPEAQRLVDALVRDAPRNGTPARGSGGQGS